jgi:AraC family transcriptional regulator of adaptative response/methylated-DNA-[protein]-cysteine methyltransferase
VGIEWGFTESPFGWCSLGWNVRGVCHLAFHEAKADCVAPVELREGWPNAELRRNDRGARRRAKIIFGHDGNATVPLRAFVRATPFQAKVWRALLRIPEGSVVSYGAVAGAIGDPRAARAVGAACAANPIAYLIPCHRVIRETGVVRGYRWGNTRKRALLAWESACAAPGVNGRTPV